jgi:hypothetical protein
MFQNRTSVYVYGSTQQSQELRASLQKRGFTVLEGEEDHDQLAVCARAFLFVENLSEAESSLIPLQGIRKVQKIMITTNRKLYPVFRKLEVNNVILTRKDAKNFDWLL